MNILRDDQFKQPKPKHVRNVAKTALGILEVINPPKFNDTDLRAVTVENIATGDEFMITHLPLEGDHVNYSLEIWQPDTETDIDEDGLRLVDIFEIYRYDESYLLLHRLHYMHTLGQVYMGESPESMFYEPLDYRYGTFLEQRRANKLFFEAMRREEEMFGLTDLERNRVRRLGLILQGSVAKDRLV